MLAVPLEWEGPWMGGNLSISIAQHLMEFIHCNQLYKFLHLHPDNSRLRQFSPL